MRRSTLILIIILIIVLLGGGAYVWLKKDTLSLPWAKNSNANTTTTNVPTGVVNTANTNQPTSITLPKEIKGDTAVDATLKIGTVDLKISSQQKQVIADGETAAAGQTFLLVYFDAVDSKDIRTVDEGIRDIKIVDGKSTYPLLTLKVASTYVKGDRGYVRFAVPEKATGLLLQLGSGASAQTIKLP